MDTNQSQDSHNMPPNSSMPHTPQKNSMMAVLAYLGILIVIPFLTDAKDDPFVKFHIKQGLVLIIVELVAGFLMSTPFFFWFLGSFVWLFLVVMMILGIINAVSGKEKELPLIGHFASNFHF